MGEVLHPTHCQFLFASKCLQKTGKCLVTVIGLSPGGSSTVHIYTQTIHGTRQITTEQHKLTTNLDECVPCPIFASFTLAFGLQLRKKHGKTAFRVRKTSVRVQYTYYQNTHTLQNLHTHTHTHTHTRAHTLENPQYGRIAEAAEIGIWNLHLDYDIWM